MKVGVIGVGKMGSNHLRIYKEMIGVEVVGIADTNKDLVKTIAEKYNILGFDDYRDLIKEKVDAVSIVVPTELHSEVAINCIKAGCDVLIEKPISNTIKGALEIQKYSKKYSKKVLVGHIERFNPAVKILKDIVESGELGDIVSINTKRVGFYNPQRNNSGVILDLAPHDIDIISYLYNDRVMEVYSVAANNYNSSETHATMLMKFYKGGVGICELSWVLPKRERNLSIVGTDGFAVLDFIEQTVKVHDKRWSREANVHRQEPLRKELMYFKNYVEGKEKEPLITLEDSIHALMVALKAIESYKKDSVIKIPEVGFSISKYPKLELITSY